MIRVKKTHKILFRSIIGLLIALTLLFVFAIYLLTVHSDYIQSLTKKIVSRKIEERETELLELVEEINSQEIVQTIHLWMSEDNIVPYKDIDNKNISEVFENFSLIAIWNKIDTNGYMYFAVYPYWRYIGSGYKFGFYYSMDDKAINIFSGDYVESDKKIYIEIPLQGEMWYRTEKITDNWWYYEYQW